MSDVRELPTEFLLYRSTSTDGREPAKYERRTTSAREALEHLKLVRSSPYTAGHVVLLSGPSFSRTFSTMDGDMHDLESWVRAEGGSSEGARA